jgi:hypothetical protein
MWLPFQKKTLETFCDKKGLFFMDGHQQNKTMIDTDVEYRWDLISSQI